MTRLAEIKLELAKAERTISQLEESLRLTLTTTPQTVERFRENSDASARATYEISAYGLERPSGGTVVVRFIYPGQRDTIRTQLFDDFQAAYREDYSDTAVPFRIAIERIRVKQAQLFEEKQ